MDTTFVFLCLTFHFSIMPSRPIHVVTNGKSLQLNNIPLCIYTHTYTHHIIFIHSSINGYMLFPFLGYCKLCIWECTYLPESMLSFSSNKYPELKLLDHMIQPVHSEGDQPWDFFGRNDAKAETPVLWPPHAKS